MGNPVVNEIEKLRYDIDNARSRVVELMEKINDLWGRPPMEYSDEDWIGNFLAWDVPVPDKNADHRPRWVSSSIPVTTDTQIDVTSTYDTEGQKVTKTIPKRIFKTRTPNRTIEKNVTKIRTRFLTTTFLSFTTTTTATTSTTTTTTTTTTATSTTTPLTTTTTETQEGTVEIGNVWHYETYGWDITDAFITTHWETDDFSTGTFTTTTTDTEILTAETEVTTSTFSTTETTTTPLVPPNP